MPSADRRPQGPARPAPSKVPAGAQAWVLEAVRLPYGRRGGALSAWHPIDLLALALNEVLERAGISPGRVEEVVAGCGAQVGAQAGNVARRAVLAAGWPESVPGTTVEMQAASGARAVNWAVQCVLAGGCELVVAAGVDVMSAVPLGANLAVPSVGKPIGQGLGARYGPGTGLVPPGQAAESVARFFGLTREDLDGQALLSMERARAGARKATWLAPVPLGGRPARALRTDEALTTGLTRRALRSMSPLFEDGGVVTAANMAAEADGAAAVLIASPGMARKLRLGPKAKVEGLATVGGDPALWPLAGVKAAEAAVARLGADLHDVERYEVFESSAAAILAWTRATGVEQERVNPEGGALATGAPLGAVGAGLFAAPIAALASASVSSTLVCVAADGGGATSCLLGAL